eukprot:6025900-Pyramimonas_sp.AAC.1
MLSLLPAPVYFSPLASSWPLPLLPHPRLSLPLLGAGHGRGGRAGQVGRPLPEDDFLRTLAFGKRGFG